MLENCAEKLYPYRKYIKMYSTLFVVLFIVSSGYYLYCRVALNKDAPFPPEALPLGAMLGSLFYLSIVCSVLIYSFHPKENRVSESNPTWKYNLTKAVCLIISLFFVYAAIESIISI